MTDSKRIISGLMALCLILTVFVAFPLRSVAADGVTDLDDAEEGFWHSMASDFYYSRLSANEKKIWDRLDKACMDVLLSDDDADALIYVDVRDLGVKNDKADFLTLLFI